MDMTQCPECGLVAEVVWRDVLESTDGPVEHARITCVDKHWFLLPVASLETAVGAPVGSRPDLACRGTIPR